MGEEVAVGGEDVEFVCCFLLVLDLLGIVVLGDSGTYIATEGPGASVLESILLGKLKSTGRNAEVKVSKV
jgi:hypothetical protein